MDANETLSHLRRRVTTWQESPDSEAAAMAAVEAVMIFAQLDAHLSAGGTPPEEWREGPDAELWDTDSAEDNTALEEVEGVGIAAEPNG